MFSVDAYEADGTPVSSITTPISMTMNTGYIPDTTSSDFHFMRINTDSFGITTYSNVTSDVSLNTTDGQTFTWSQSTFSDYGIALPLQQSVIYFPAAPNMTTSYLPGTSYVLDASATSGMPITFTSSNPDVVYIDSSSNVNATYFVINGVGTSTITANSVGNNDYLNALPVQQVVTVNRASQTLTFNLTDGANVTMTAPLVATSNRGLTPVQLTSTDPSTLSIIGNNTLSTHKAGTVVITATQAGNQYYLDASAFITLNVVDITQLTYVPIGTDGYSGILTQAAMYITQFSGKTVGFTSANQNTSTFGSLLDYMNEYGDVIYDASSNKYNIVQRTGGVAMTFVEDVAIGTTIQSIQVTVSDTHSLRLAVCVKPVPTTFKNL
jgi:hypothetical protein